MPIDHRLREALDAYAARVRHDLDAHLRSLTSDVMRLVGDERDRWRSELERTSSEARAEALAEADARKREVRIDTVERLLTSIRRIDDAGSLSDILEALIEGASAETSRVALLIVEGDQLDVWGHRGFLQGTHPIPMPIDASTTLAAAMATRQSTFVPPSDGRDRRPAFMRVPFGQTAFVVPVTVGGDVVALLYADDVDRVPVREDAPIWTEELELMVRHASVRLEKVTSARVVEVAAHPN
jgi:hypothetical protein